MPNYTVTWSIDIEGVDSPQEAAEEARLHQLREGTTATVFEVQEQVNGESKLPEKVVVDLGEI